MIRVGLVGYGLAGRVFHAPYIAATPGLVLAAVATSRADEVRRDHPDARVATAEDVIAASDIDLVVLATPNDSHQRLALAALAADKAVVIDKPMALSTGDAERLIETAEARGLPLAAFHNRRWDDDFLALCRHVRAGELGDLVTLESRFDQFRPQPQDRWREKAGPGGGIWWDLGPHLVDQALLLMGRPEAVTADIARQRRGAEADDYAHVILHYGRARAILRAGRLVGSGPPRFTAEGEQGSFATWGMDPQEARLRTPGAAQAERIGVLRRQGQQGAVETREALPPGDYGVFYRMMVDAMTREGPPPVAPHEALAVTEVLEAALVSAAERRTVALG